MKDNGKGQDRRARIAEAVIAILSADGARGLSHKAVDRHLDLPAGSTSYYFRTRRDLMTAAAQRLIERSREHFTELTATLPTTPTTDSAAEQIVDYLHHLATSRRDDIRARLALLPEVQDPELRGLLVRAFFSLDAALGLCHSLDHPRPAAAAAGLLDLLEGAALRAGLDHAPPDTAMLTQNVVQLVSRPMAQ